MSVTRNIRQQPFAMVPNEWMRDPKLSMADKGLLSYLLTHTESYDLSVMQIVGQMRDGHDAVTRSLKRLEEAGYLRRERRRDENKLSRYDWMLADPDAEVESTGLKSEDSATRSDTLAGQGKSDKPRTSFPGLEDQGSKNTTVKNITEEDHFDDVAAATGLRRREASSREFEPANPIPPQRRSDDREQQRAEDHDQSRAAAIPAVVERFAAMGWNDFDDYHAGFLLDQLSKRRKISDYVEYLDVMSDDDLNRRWKRAWAARKPG